MLNAGKIDGKRKLMSGVFAMSTIGNRTYVLGRESAGQHGNLDRNWVRKRTRCGGKNCKEWRLVSCNCYSFGFIQLDAP